MRTQFVLSALALAAGVTAQSSSSFITTPIDITGTNISPPPATPTSIETQSPRPSLSVPSSGSEAPTETFPSFTDAPTETMPTIVPSVTQPSATNTLSSVIGSASSALSSLASAASTRSASTVASSSASASPNAGVPLQIGVTGWTVGVVLAGVAAGAALL